MPMIRKNSLPLQKPKFEEVQETQSESIRIFRWDKNLDEVYPIVGHNQKNATSTGMGSQWHYHPQVELTYFLAGEGVRFIGDSISHFKAPEIVLIGSQLPHYWKLESSSGLSIQFRNSADSPLAGLPEFNLLAPLWKRSLHGLLFQGTLKDRLSHILRHAATSSPISRLAMLLEILDAINEGQPEEQETLSKRSMPQHQSSTYQRSIQKAVQFISTHFKDNITIGDTLNACGLTRATFSRHFNRAVGHSFSSFLVSLRIENARRLIASGQYSVTSAAFESGFNNLSYFNRVFKKRWNYTPTDFKKNLFPQTSDAASKSPKS